MTTHSNQCLGIGNGPGHDACVCYCHRNLPEFVRAMDELAARIDRRLDETADSIRGGKVDAGRDQCSREWAAQQVGYYARAAIHDELDRWRRAWADPTLEAPRERS